MRLFCREYPVDRTDVAKAFGKKVEELTREDLLSLIPVSRFDRKIDTDNTIEFILTTERDRYYDKTLKHRLNSLWVYPLALLLMPFKWLFTGVWGFSHSTKFGRFLGNLVGEN